ELEESIQYGVIEEGLHFAELLKKYMEMPLEELLTVEEKIAEEEAEKEKPLAPQLAAKVLEERLPGAAFRIAMLIHALEEGKITPEQLTRYIETLHSPESPHGTALYNIIHRLINHYEEKVANNEEVPPPSQAIKTLQPRNQGKI
ncbi:MAG: hypothetical protein GSR73_03540, partial [Desulfurococcales archaeon]|nr:hypothetical protein [Desulfurococcales archaeon]